MTKRDRTGKNNAFFGKHHTQEAKEAMSIGHKKYVATPEGYAQILEASKLSCTPEAIVKSNAANMGRIAWNKGLTKESDSRVMLWSKPQSEEHKRKRAEAQKTYYQNPIAKAKRAETTKKLWQDPKYIKKMFKALAIKPNKPELALQSILDKHFPEFKYNGDYSLGITLTGMIPDFININGKKQVIELFGTYWHSPKRAGKNWKGTELGKIMAYSSIGYKCLIIWENELKNPQAINEKIRRWQNGEKGR